MTENDRREEQKLTGREEQKLSRVVGKMTMKVKLPRRSARLRWGDIVKSSWRDDNGGEAP